MHRILILILTIASLHASGQKYMTKTGHIEFNANTPVEKIEAENNALVCLLDIQTGNLDVIAQIKSFVFEKQLMQEHFNENYLESDQFPKASFKGKITNIKNINVNTDGEYPAEVSGKLTIHGVTKDIKSQGKISVKGKKVIVKSTFSVLLSDYNIKIPGAVKDKISKEARVSLQCLLEEMNK
jgi:hypothetical protein